MKEDEASSTAYIVLQGLLYTASRPRYNYLVAKDVEEAGRQILSASKTGRKLLKQINNPLIRVIAPFLEWLLMPGISRHYVLRKRYIEDAVRAAIKQEATQVVNLGAGFDTLAWRLHKEFSGVNFIEIDHPATNAQKAKALMGGETSPSNLHMLAVDFSKQNLLEALSPFEGFEAKRKTIFICEGVLMYLLEKDVVTLFDSLKQLTGKGTQLVFTCVEPMESPSNNNGRLLKFLYLIKNEPLNWIMARPDLPDFVEKQGYKMLETASAEIFKERYLSSDHKGVVHQGEYLALAEFS